MCSPPFRHKAVTRQGIQERLFTLAFSGLSANAYWNSGNSTFYFRASAGGTFRLQTDFRPQGDQAAAIDKGH